MGNITVSGMDNQVINKPFLCVMCWPTKQSDAEYVYNGNSLCAGCMIVSSKAKSVEEDLRRQYNEVMYGNKENKTI